MSPVTLALIAVFGVGLTAKMAGINTWVAYGVPVITLASIAVYSIAIKRSNEPKNAQ